MANEGWIKRCAEIESSKLVLLFLLYSLLLTIQIFVFLSRYPERELLPSVVNNVIELLYHIIIVNHSAIVHSKASETMARSDRLLINLYQVEARRRRYRYHVQSPKTVAVHVHLYRYTFSHIPSLLGSTVVQSLRWRSKQGRIGTVLTEQAFRKMLFDIDLVANGDPYWHVCRRTNSVIHRHSSIRGWMNSFVRSQVCNTSHGVKTFLIRETLPFSFEEYNFHESYYYYDV